MKFSYWDVSDRHWEVLFECEAECREAADLYFFLTTDSNPNGPWIEMTAETSVGRKKVGNLPFGDDREQ